MGRVRAMDEGATERALEVAELLEAGGYAPPIELEFRRLRDGSTSLCAVAEVAGMGRVVLVHAPVKPKATVGAALDMLNKVHGQAREAYARLV